MIVTEEEAKTKHCPLARQAFVSSDGSVVPPHNRLTTSQKKMLGRHEEISGSVQCLGANCMFWNWVGERELSEKITVKMDDLETWGLAIDQITRGKLVTFTKGPHSEKKVKIENIWRDAATKERFARLEVHQDEAVKVGRCGAAGAE